jgi:hypothetical protein
MISQVVQELQQALSLSWSGAEAAGWPPHWEKQY